MKGKFDEKIYNKFKDKIIEVGYLNNNFLKVAKSIRKEDEKFDEKINIIKEYLYQKMKEGDSIAYALVYARYENELSKRSELDDYDKIGKYFEDHPDIQLKSENLFFDPKVIYYADVLGDLYEGS